MKLNYYLAIVAICAIEFVAADYLTTTTIGGYEVKPLCTPIYANWSEQKPIYGSCTDSYLDCKNTTGKFTDCVVIKNTWNCITSYEQVEHTQEQVDCIINGKIDISNKVYEYNNFYCKIEGEYLTCISNKEGGQYNTCKADGSVTCYRKNLITNKEDYFNSLKTALK